jgi:hypothetical protein
VRWSCRALSLTAKHGWGTGNQHESLGCSSVTDLVLNDRGRAAFFEGVPSGQAAVHKLDATVSTSSTSAPSTRSRSAPGR